MTWRLQQITVYSPRAHILLPSAILVLGVVIFLLAMSLQYFRLSHRRTGAATTSVSATPSLKSVRENRYTETARTLSPDGSYVVTEEMLGDYIQIRVDDSQGKVISDDLVHQNWDRIGYNKKFGCLCVTSFGEWVDQQSFSIVISNGAGEEYEYIVNAETGRINEDTFKRIR